MEASGNITLDGGENGIHILGKVDASGRIDIKGWVHIDGNVKGTNVKIQSHGPPGSRYQIRIGGKIETNGALSLEGDVVV